MNNLAERLKPEVLEELAAEDLSMGLPVQIIDPHLHGRDLRQKHKTTVKQVMEEARSAGILTSVFMPNTEEPLITVEAALGYFELIQQAENELGIWQKQYLYFGVTDNNLDECEKALALPEVVGLKIYPKAKTGKVVTTGSIGVTKDKTITKALRMCKDHNKVAAVHCDDPEIIALEGHSTKAEASYVEKIICLMKAVPGVRVVICHVSCIESGRKIMKAQKKGLKIAIELSPHHLWFDNSGTNWGFGNDPVFYHCLNPLRSSKHRHYLIRLLNSNNPLVFVASDSACHTLEEKWRQKPAGIPSNQEMVAVVVTLAKLLGLTDRRVAQLLAFNAADFLGISIPRTLRKVSLELREVTASYNDGRVFNPWKGTKLLFPIIKGQKKRRVYEKFFSGR